MHKELDQLKESAEVLEHVQKTTPTMPGANALAEIRQKIAALQDQLTQSQPLEKRIRGIEAHLERGDKVLAKLGAVAVDQQIQIAQLNAELAKTRQAYDDRAVDQKKYKAELATLLAQKAAEAGAPPAAPAPVPALAASERPSLEAFRSFVQRAGAIAGGSAQEATGFETFWSRLLQVQAAAEAGAAPVPTSPVIAAAPPPEPAATPPGSQQELVGAAAADGRDEEPATTAVPEVRVAATSGPAADSTAGDGDIAMAAVEANGSKPDRGCVLDFEAQCAVERAKRQRIQK